MTCKVSSRLAVATAVFAIATGLTNAVRSAEVNIYSYRKEALIKPQLEAFKKATGISYNLITGKAGGLMQRLKNEGMNSPADLLFTVDAGRLHRAIQMELLQSLIEAFHLDLKIAQGIFLRWEQSKHKLVKDFAPLREHANYGRVLD